MTIYSAVPQRALTLNRSSQLASGLVYMSVAQRNSWDLAKNRPAATENMNYYSFMNQGLTNAGGVSQSFLADFNFTGGPFTVATYMNLSTLANVSSFPDVFGQNTYSSESVNAGWNLQIGNTPTWGFNTYGNVGAATYQLNSSVTPVVGNHVIIGVLTASNKFIYVDGTQSTNTNGLTIGAVAGGNLQIGSQGNGVSSYWSGIWNRALTQGEAQLLTQNPWILFARPHAKISAGIIPATAQQKAGFMNFFPQV